MSRRISAVVLTVFSFAVLAAAPAGATNPVPAGSINCTFSFMETFKPGITATASTTPLKAPVTSLAADSSCDNSGVTAGTSKFPITAVSVKVKAIAPTGASCFNFANAPLQLTGKAQVKFWGLNPSGKLATVAVVNTTIASSAVDSQLHLVLTPATKGAFVGQTIAIALNGGTPTGNCGDPTGVTEVSSTGTLTSP